MTAPLAPYRVLDFTDDRGHLTGMMLAGLGADVIAVEPPGGSAARNLAPFLGDEGGLERSLTHWAYNRGKRSVVLDLGSPAGRDHARRLAAGADLVIESGAPGELAALGLGYEELAAVNPGLVYVSLSPFGQTGPKAHWPASDLTLLAAGGPLVLTGDAERPPCRVSVPQAWLIAGSAAASGALLALYERGRSGRGQHVDVSAQQAATIATQAQVLSVPSHAPSAVRSGGAIKMGDLRLRFVWPAKDGFVSITHVFGVSVGPVTRRLMDWVHEAGYCDEATRDKDWVMYGMALTSGEEPPAEYARVQGCIEAFTASRTKAELLEGAMNRRVLVAPVTSTADVVESEQFADRRYFEEVEHAELGRSIRYPGPWARLSRTPLEVLPRAPRLGEHTAAVLAEPPRAPAPAAPEPTPPALPLAGLKVLDLMWAVAGPTMTRVLADFGATVVRVESTVRLDAARAFQPFMNDDVGAESSTLFSSLNAGKRSICVDLGSDAGREVILDLVRWADVVTEAFSPKAMKSWGLDYESLRAVNPGLVMLSTCLMGQSGPLALFAGYGNLAGAICGFYNLTGWPDLAPAGPFAAYTDYVAPHFSLTALLAALEHRRRTGEGQYIDFSQAEAGLHHLSPALLEYTANGRIVERMGNDDREAAPHGVYPARGVERWVAIACTTDEQWRALAEEMGRVDLASDAALATAAGRLARRRQLDDAVAAWTCGLDEADVTARLIARGVPAHVVQNSAECVADPQLAHRGHFVTVPHSVIGEHTIEGARVALSRTPAQITTGGPALNEHLFEVLHDLLGYDEDRIAELIAREVFA
ncbi:MAG: CaiB/BaiF CoA transferase family protein [Acidimicrobiales bacterium]